MTSGILWAQAAIALAGLVAIELCNRYSKGNCLDKLKTILAKVPARIQLAVAGIVILIIGVAIGRAS